MPEVLKNVGEGTPPWGTSYLNLRYADSEGCVRFASLDVICNELRSGVRLLVCMSMLMSVCIYSVSYVLLIANGYSDCN